MQLASTLSLFFSAALKLLLGFSPQLQKLAKVQMFSTPCPSVTSLGLSFLKSFTFGDKFEMEFGKMEMDWPNIERQPFYMMIETSGSK